MSVASVGAAGSSAVTTVTSQTEVVVANATGFTSGEYVWLETSDGWRGPVRIDEVSGTSITLESPPPGTVTTAAIFYGMRLSATIAAGNIATTDKYHQLRWVITDVAGAVTERFEVAHVVRMVFDDPVTGTEAKRFVDANFPGVAAAETAGWFRELSERANARIRDLIRTSGDAAHMLGDQSVFKQAGVVGLRLELADLGFVVGGIADVADYLVQQERRLRQAISEAIAQTWIDKDQDLAVDVSTETGRGLWTLEVARR